MFLKELWYLLSGAAALKTVELDATLEGHSFQYQEVSVNNGLLLFMLFELHVAFCYWLGILNNGILSAGSIVPAFLKELIYKVHGLQVLFLELDRFEIPLGEWKEGQLVLKVVLLCLIKRTMCYGRLVFFGDANRKITVTETFYVKTNDELSEKELKQIEADDQAIQTILLDLPEDIYAAVDSCETAQEIWLRVQQIMKGSDIGIQEKKAKLFNEWERFTSNEGESIESYYHHFLKLMNDLKRNKHFPEKIASNLKFLNNLQPEWSRHVTIVHQTKDLHTTYYTQLYDFLKYNQIERISSNPRNMQIAQPGMNMGQDRQMQMVRGYGENQFRQYAGQNAGNLNGYNAVQNVGNQVAQNPRVQNVGNQNGLIGVQGNRNQNQIGNGNLVAVRAERNAAGHNGNQIRCYNCRGVEGRGRNPTSSRRQASTSGTQTDIIPVYDSDGSAEVHENCDNNEIFNMFTQEEQYTELLEPIPELQQVPQNNNNVIYEIRCYNYRGVGHYARNCTVRPRRRDAAYLQKQLLIAQKEEAGIQLQAEEYDLMAAAADLDEIEEVNANCILMTNLQQASTSGT
nr:Gag-Pol polyprotein [Tanacetum cinerariifolium]